MIESLLQAVASIKARLDRLEGKSYGGRWVNWTPTVTQGVAVAVTVTEAKYCIIGKIGTAYCKLAVTGAGTSGGGITVSGQPAAMQPALVGDNTVIGTGMVLKSGVANYVGAVVPISATQWKLLAHAQGDYVGSQPTFALANGDKIAFTATFRVA